MNKSEPLFMLTVSQFTELIDQLIRQAVNELPAIQQPVEDSITEMDINGLAGFLRCSKMSIHNYKKKGLPFYRVGRKLLFDKNEVLAFMASVKKPKNKPQ